MAWILAISVILNIALLILTIFFVYSIGQIDSASDHYLEQYTIWERRFYEMQSKLIDEHGIVVSITKGEHGTMMAEKKEINS